MQKLKKRAYGNRYEALASEYLAAKGYQILAKNVNFKWGEIDLVAEVPIARGSCLVFIEVRKRDPRSFLRPEETLTFPKQRRLKAAIQSYLLKYQGRATEMRIDLIGFDGEELQHKKNFFPLDLS